MTDEGVQLPPLRESVDRQVRLRAKRHLKSVGALLTRLCYEQAELAGNCLNPGRVNDIDIYVEHLPTRRPGLEVLSERPKVLTVAWGDTPVQFCVYPHETLMELVSSFDFAHVQVGCQAIANSQGQWATGTIFWTAEFLHSRATGLTWYTHSAYPISSMLRMLKYAKRDYPKLLARYSLLRVLRDVLALDLPDHQSYLDQLEAVDVAILDTLEPEGVGGSLTDAAMALKELLVRG